jgi:hypothetical protein
MVVSVSVNAGCPVVPVSLLLSMVVESSYENRGVLPRARMSDLSVFSLSPGSTSCRDENNGRSRWI